MANSTMPIYVQEDAPLRLQFFVRISPNNKNIVIQCSGEDTVESVHERIERRIGIPIREQRLIYSKKQLHWKQSLSECGIQNDESLQLVGRLQSGTFNPRQQEHAVFDMFSRIRRMSNGEGGTTNISNTLEPFMKRIFKLNAFKHLIAHKGLVILVSLYTSRNNPRNKDVGGSTIKLFLKCCDSLFNKCLNVSSCLRALVELCKHLRVRAGDYDKMYETSLVILRNLMESVRDGNPNQKVVLECVYDYVRELVSVLLEDIDWVRRIPKMRLQPTFQHLVLFLIPLAEGIKGLQAWEAQLFGPRGYNEAPSLANEICQLHLMYVQILNKLEGCLQGMEDYWAKSEEGWDVVENQGWAQYLPIIMHMCKLSTLFHSTTEEMCRGVFMQRGHILSLLIIQCVKRNNENDDHEWVYDYKSVISSEARRHLATMVLSSTNEHDSEDEEDGHEVLIHNRSDLLDESFYELIDASPKSLRSGIYVYFLGEEGTGQGVLKEWIFLVCREIFNPLHGYFVACPSDRRRFFPNPASVHLNYFSFFGRMVALALIYKVQLGIVFDRVFFMQLAGKCIMLEDIQDADPYLYRGCKQILEMDVDFVDSDALGLTFVREVEEESSGHMKLKKVIELCPGGENLVVNSKNRKEYVDLLIHNHFVTSISEHVSHFAYGFGEIITDTKLQKLFQILELEDFDKMLHGRENAISVEDWKAHTTYVGYEKTDIHISWFWEVVRRMSTERRKILLFFWTSIKYLPFEGFRGLGSKLQIVRSDEEPHHRLPTSHTCFFRLYIPSYSSFSVMQYRFRIITDQEYISYGFGID